MNDRIMLVTGGAGNVGRAVTEALLQRGARIAVPFYKTDHPDALEELREEHGDRLFDFALDLTTERGADLAVREVVEWGGRLDGVVHMVGGYSGGPLLADTPIEIWDRMFDLNLKSAWLVARAAIPELIERGGGPLVFVSSRAARSHRVGNGAYAISKAALITLAGTISDEYGDRGVRANAVLPGTVDTEANRKAMPDADHSQWTDPAEIAQAIAFLASDASRAINGAALPVYGRS